MLPQFFISFHLIYWAWAIASSETQGLWVDFKSGWKSPWGHCLTRLVPNGRSRSGILLVPGNLCVFLPNQSVVCFRVLSCVLARRCTRSLVARLVCLGCATKLFSRWKVLVSAHNVREIDEIVRENLTRSYTESTHIPWVPEDGAIEPAFEPRRGPQSSMMEKALRIVPWKLWNEGDPLKNLSPNRLFNVESHNWIKSRILFGQRSEVLSVELRVENEAKLYRYCFAST